jgi:uncharacterized membrane protein YfcA
LTFVLVLVAVFIGAAGQRIAGLGFGLVAGPLMVLLLGPHNGVGLANALAVILSFSVLARVWRDVRWKRALILVASAAVGTYLGSLVLKQLSTQSILIGVGILVILAVSLVAAGRRIGILSGPGGAAVTGVVSGFMNVTAAVGGPIVAVHALTDRWETKTFVATAQVYFAASNSMSLLFRGLPTIEWHVWLGSGIVLLAGIVAGHFLHRIIPAASARRIIIGLAFAGGLGTLIRGLLG